MREEVFFVFVKEDDVSLNKAVDEKSKQSAARPRKGCGLVVARVLTNWNGRNIKRRNTSEERKRKEEKKQTKTCQGHV